MKISESLSIKIIKIIKEEFDIEVNNIKFILPNKIEMGDLSTTIAFEISKLIKNKKNILISPFEIATIIADKLNKK